MVLVVGPYTTIICIVTNIQALEEIKISPPILSEGGSLCSPTKYQSVLKINNTTCILIISGPRLGLLRHVAQIYKLRFKTVLGISFQD